MKRVIVVIGVMIAAFAVAGQLVDQGQPGAQGSWPVRVTAGSITVGGITAIDGGNITVNGTVAIDGGNIVVTGTVALDGGYTTPVPGAAATNILTNGTGVPSNGTPCTVIGGASCTDLLGTGSGGSDYLRYQNLTITIVNQGANPLTNGLVGWSGNGVNFETWDATTFAGLASGATLSLAVAGNSRRFLRVEGRSAAGTTVAIQVTANSQAY